METKKKYIRCVCFVRLLYACMTGCVYMKTRSRMQDLRHGEIGMICMMYGTVWLYDCMMHDSNHMCVCPSMAWTISEPQSAMHDLSIECRYEPICNINAHVLVHTHTRSYTYTLVLRSSGGPRVEMDRQDLHHKRRGQESEDIVALQFVVVCGRRRLWGWRSRGG